MSNLNEGFNERPIDPPNYIDLGRDPDADYDAQRATEHDDSLDVFFEPNMPIKVIELMNRAMRLRIRGEKFDSERVMGKALDLMIEARNEQNAVTEISARDLFSPTWREHTVSTESPMRDQKHKHPDWILANPFRRLINFLRTRRPWR